MQANIRKNTSLKTQKIRIKKSWEKCFLYGGCLLQYYCIKTAGVATFGKPRIFEKKLKNFRAMCADTEKHVLPRLDTRGKKANFNRCKPNRRKSPAFLPKCANVFAKMREC